MCIHGRCMLHAPPKNATSTNCILRNRNRMCLHTRMYHCSTHTHANIPPELTVTQVGPHTHANIPPELTVTQVGPHTHANIPPELTVTQVGPHTHANIPPELTVTQVGPHTHANIPPELTVTQVGTKSHLFNNKIRCLCGFSSLRYFSIFCDRVPMGSLASST